MTTWAILGAGGSFAINTAKFLLRHHPHLEIIGIGRNPLRANPAFNLGIEEHPRVRYYARHLNFELDMVMDILDQYQPEVIINYAAQGEGAVSWKNSWRYFDTNATALVRLVEELMKRPMKLKRFVQIGSSEVYGSNDRPVNENAPVKPTSPYAASKLAFDFYLMSVFARHQFPMNLLRPSNAYGPGQLLHRVIPRAIVAGLTGGKLPLQGGGAVRKSYIHIDDLAYAIDLVVRMGHVGAVYNVGPEVPISIREVVVECATALGMSFDDLVVEAPARQNEDATYWLDSSRLIHDTGWHPTVSWEVGLARMVQWGEQYIDHLREAHVDYEFRA